MDPTPDELAGVVDLFGALTRAELRRGLAELAFKRGGEYDPDRFEDTVTDALGSYHLVAVDAASAGTTDPGGSAGDASDGGELLVVGPVAFPELPEDASDLPHILDVPDRELDREDVVAAAAEQFRRDAASAIDAGDGDRIRSLLDTSYELEGWGGLDLAATRERMDDERNQ